MDKLRALRRQRSSALFASGHFRGFVKIDEQQKVKDNVKWRLLVDGPEQPSAGQQAYMCTLSDQVDYDAHENFIAVFSRWRGTVLPLVLQKVMFWVFISFYVMLLVIDTYFYELPDMDLEIVIGECHGFKPRAVLPSLVTGARVQIPHLAGLPASLLIFLTVFYNGECYTRFFELWGLCCDLTALVNDWIVQTSFLLEEFKESGEMPKSKKTGEPYSLDYLKWRTARRLLSAMQMLFMSLEDNVEDFDSLGRPLKMPNIMQGEGLDPPEYELLVAQGLLTVTRCCLQTSISSPDLYYGQ